jgi:pimeloyl-ACP methyl ester carboxylesterase
MLNIKKLKKDLRRYIIYNLNNGISIENIRKDLIESGYNPSFINEFISSCEKKELVFRYLTLTVLIFMLVFMFFPFKQQFTGFAVFDANEIEQSKILTGIINDTVNFYTTYINSRTNNPISDNNNKFCEIIFYEDSKWTKPLKMFFNNENMRYFYQRKFNNKGVYRWFVYCNGTKSGYDVSSDFGVIVITERNETISNISTFVKAYLENKNFFDGIDSYMTKEDRAIQNEIKKEVSYRTLFGISPEYRIVDPSYNKKIGSTSITPADVNVSPITCVMSNISIDKEILFKKENLTGFTIPKGYEAVIPPFKIECDNEDFSFNLNLPENYKEIQILRCGKDGCPFLELNKIENLECGNNLDDKYLRKENYIEPSIKFNKTIINLNSLEINNNKIRFFGNLTDFKVTIKNQDKKLFQPKNPTLQIIGTPFVLKVDTTNDDNINSEVTIPYNIKDNIDESTIQVYININETKWFYVGGEINKRAKTVTANITNITKYLNEDNEIVIALAGVICINCLKSNFEMVYQPETNSRDAVILIHGLLSSPVTYQDVIKDIKLTKQPWQAWTFGYPYDRPIKDNAKELADYLQANSDKYDNIYIIAHSLGGLIAQQAIYMSYLENQNNSGKYSYIKKIRKLILISVPNKGSPVGELYLNIFKHLINLNKRYNLFNLHSEIISELVKGVITPRVPTIDYYVIAGTKTYEFNAAFFKLSANKLFNDYPNDGIISTRSAQAIGDTYVEDKCKDYWEVNVTHTELVDDPVPRKLVERIIAMEILNKINNTPIIGYNSYYKIDIDKCSSNERYLIIGKKIRREQVYDPIGCSCGNGYCGDGETIENCPIDCIVKKKSSNLRYLSFVLIIFLIIVTYKLYGKKLRKKILRRRAIHYFRDVLKKERKKEEKTQEEKPISKTTGYETELDLFYKAIVENEKIKLSEIIKKFRISKEIALRWAKILEKNKLIKIHYPVIGNPILSVYKEKKKE